MKEVLYYNLKESFVKIKLLFSANVLDTNKVDAVVGDLKFSRKQIEKHSKRREKRLLLCCIDTLLRFIEEDKKEKICDFASVICDIPDIFLGKRNYYSFREDINAFNEKYGEHTFKDMNKINLDFSEVKGQESVKRALEIAAAGSHNCLLIGSPGSRENNACKKNS